MKGQKEHKKIAKANKKIDKIITLMQGMGALMVVFIIGYDLLAKYMAWQYQSGWGLRSIAMFIFGAMLFLGGLWVKK